MEQTVISQGIEVKCRVLEEVHQLSAEDFESFGWDAVKIVECNYLMNETQQRRNIQIPSEMAEDATFINALVDKIVGDEIKSQKA